MPAHFKKGISISYLFGNNGFFYKHNRSFYTAARERVCMTKNDLRQVRQAGFDHVRIMLDPQYLGVGSDGFIVESRIAPFGGVGITETVGMRIQRLKDFIHLANGQDLAVMIQFNVPYLSPEDYKRDFDAETTRLLTEFAVGTAGYQSNVTYLSRRFKPSVGGPYTFSNGTNYPGPYRKDFMSLPNDLPLQSSNMIPLEQFWNDFTTKILTVPAGNQSPTDEVKHMSPSMLMFEVASEPLTNADPTMFPIGSGLSVMDWHDAFQEHVERYASIQRRAVNAIQRVNSNFYIGITSPNSFPWDFYPHARKFELEPRYLDQAINMGVQIDAYFDELESMPSVIRSDRILYCPHFYNPFAFTHRDSSTRTYGKNRDYYGVGVPSTDPLPSSADEIIRTGRAFDYMVKQFNNLTDAFPIGSSLGDIVPASVDNSSYTPWARKLSNEAWDGFNGVPLIWTEFGARRKDANGRLWLDSERDILVAPIGSERSPDGRVEWHEDARKLIENADTFSSMGEGWTVFEYMGEFGLFGKYLSASSNSQPVIRSSEVRGISQDMKNALFLP